MFYIKKSIGFIFSIMMLPASALSETSNIIHDAHIHYDADVWQMLPAADAIRFLKEQNIRRALVSATPTEGAEKLYREDPDLVIPMLRPYRNELHRYLWFKDPELKSYLLMHLDKVPYRGFGEFHVSGQHADALPVAEMIEMARERDMVLHAHTDLEGMRIILKKASGIDVIWAHGGFDVALTTLRDLLETYPQFYIELSLREGMLDEEEQLTPQWKNLLISYASRFFIGMDTYKPSRWADLPETAAEARHWLAQLPDDVAADIARNNLDRLFPRIVPRIVPH